MAIESLVDYAVVFEKLGSPPSENTCLHSNARRKPTVAVELVAALQRMHNITIGRNIMKHSLHEGNVFSRRADSYQHYHNW